MTEERNEEYGRDEGARSKQIAPHDLSGTLSNRPPAFKLALSIAMSTDAEVGDFENVEGGC